MNNQIKAQSEKQLAEFKKRFKEWCGFELEGESKQDIVDEIKTRQWQMECDLNMEAKKLGKRLDEIMHDKED